MRYSKGFLLGTDWKGGENPFQPSRGVNCFLDSLLGGGDASQTTTSTPYGDEQWTEYREGASDWYQGPGAALNPEALTAPRNAMQTGAEDQFSNYINSGAFGDPLASGGQATNQFLSNPYGGINYQDLTSNPAQYGLTNANANPALQQQLSGDPFQNPALESMIQSVQQGTMEDYNRNIAPLDRQAITYSQPGGGSRGDLLQARSRDDLSQNLMNTRAGLTYGGYENALRRQDLGIGNQLQSEQLGEYSRSGRAGEGLNRYLGGVQGYGGLANTALQGYGGMGVFGENKRAFDQEVADEATFRWDYDQNQDYRALQQYGGLLNQLPAGGTQTTTMDDGTSSAGQLASLGLGLGSLYLDS